jgi:FKBP-type peptidyl-prolyl cis-trans isomerase 2
VNTRKGAVFFIAILLLVCTILSSGCMDNGSDGGNSRAVKPGDKVHVDYTGKLENDTVFDTSREDVAKQAGIYVNGRTYVPLTFVVGSGQMIKGFDKGVIGMKVGEEKTITIPPEEAYGEYDKSKVLAVPIEELNLTEPPEAGQKLPTNYGLITIVEVNKTHAMIDFNSELAGKTLIFDIKLVSIE